MFELTIDKQGGKRAQTIASAQALARSISTLAFAAQFVLVGASTRDFQGDRCA